MSMMGELADARKNEADAVLVGFISLKVRFSCRSPLSSRAHIARNASIIRCYRSILRICGSDGLKIGERRRGPFEEILPAVLVSE
jgi:hypothetical protein